VTTSSTDRVARILHFLPGRSRASTPDATTVWPAGPRDGGATSLSTDKRGRQWTAPAIAGVGGLVLGLLMGSMSDPTESAEYRALADELATVRQVADDEQGRADDAEERVDVLTKEVASGEEAVAAAQAATVAAQAATDAAAAKEVELVAKEADIVARESAVASVEAAHAAKAAAPVPAAPKAQVAPAAPSAPARTGGFANCSEARAAGAAPVRRGDAGYSSSLDRDGDGIGCE
jgi:hypothetical protein